MFLAATNGAAGQALCLCFGCQWVGRSSLQQGERETCLGKEKAPDDDDR